MMMQNVASLALVASAGDLGTIQYEAIAKLKSHFEFSHNYLRFHD